MSVRTPRQSLAAVLAAAACLSLAACNNDTSVSGASSTSSASTSNVGQSEMSSTPSSSSSSAASSAPSSSSSSASAEQPEAPAPTTDPGKADTLTLTGGWIISGNFITFVYRNGMRYVVDAGTAISNAKEGKYTSDRGTLTLRDGKATWAGKGFSARADVNRKGAGSVLDRSGAIAVTADGSVACATDKRIAFVGVDGRRGEANTGGAVFIDKDGKRTSIGKPADQGRMIGRYSVCNVGGRSSVEVFDDVLFDFGSDKLTSSGQALVKAAAATISGEVKGKTVRIVGHTDAKGSTQTNLALGKRRAQTVSDELKKLIPGLQTEVRSAGETQPTAPNLKADGADNPEGRALNRRVEISWAH